MPMRVWWQSWFWNKNLDEEEKNIKKLEKELEEIFDNANVDELEIDMGLLVRRKKENGYEWLIEV